MSGEAKPYSKAQQLARGVRKYRRKVASPKAWQRIADAKQGACLGCGAPPPNDLHHVVPRGAPWFGDDVTANIVPLCRDCHNLVTRRIDSKVYALCALLDDDEYAYAITKGGEDFFVRAYGLRYRRV